MIRPLSEAQEGTETLEIKAVAEGGASSTTMLNISYWPSFGNDWAP